VNRAASDRDPSPLAPRVDSQNAGFEVVDFDTLDPVPCPCGLARRAFAQVSDFPATVHVTEIHATARRHYHKRLTETYYVLECDDGAYLELDDLRLPVHVGSCVLIRPGTRHRAVGRMKVLILVLPKFDATDEWFD
jgi:mannose-6-phosphate isomerase-like protein (cupin superfamily)